MARMEISCRRFALFGGAPADADAYAVCVHPGAPSLQKRGTLALLTEPAGSLAQGEDTCKLVQRSVIEGYFSDQSLGLTGSFLNALDAANNSVLQYNAGWADNEEAQSQKSASAVAQAIKSRKSRVGMTAILIRPDGTGMYLAQMAPTQVYILHNDVLTALPEPQAWRPPERQIITLKRIVDAEEESDQDEEADVAPVVSDLPEPALPLGSAPGVEADLIYRRISAGDKVIMVSADLARYIDKEWAEQTFEWKDADGIADALYTLAMERTLAEAHACVLELGVTASSGVEVDYTAPVAPKLGKQIAQEGGVSIAPELPQTHKQPGGNLIEALRGPRDWLARRRSEPQAPQAPAPVEAQPHEPIEPSYVVHIQPGAPMEAQQEQHATANQGEEQDGDAERDIWSHMPTQLFTKGAPDLPPYQSQAMASEEEESGDAEELQFDGWEDTPPALDAPKFNASHSVIYKPRLFENSDFEDFQGAYGTYTEGANALSAPQVHMHIVEDEAQPTPINKASAGDVAQRAIGWTGKTLRSVLPEKVANRMPAARAGASGGRKMFLPLRFVILGVLAIVGLVLVFSLISSKGNPQKTAAHNLLTEAQTLETSANQSGVSDSERLEKLQLALDKAQQAADDDPSSKDVTTLIGKLNGEIDTARGITRLTSLKVLFDLGAIDAAANPAAQVGAATGATAATTPAATTAATAKLDIVGQGNDLYVLDHSTNRMYRCQIAAKSCAPLISKGDNVNGTNVSDLVAVTLRVGSPVVLDTQLVSYVYNADTGAWEAQQLGAADSLKQPLGIATYDGNLYLLGAKAGQISKYITGQYGAAPIDWITDGPTVDAMKSPVAIAIDGAIYVTLADGKILVMQGGKLVTTITPKTSPGMGDPSYLYTGTDLQNIYLLRSSDGSITKINKDGKTLSILAPPTNSDNHSFSGMSVDEGKNKIYLSQGRTVYEAAFPVAGANTSTQVQTQDTITQTGSQTPQPTVRPTVVP